MQRWPAIFAIPLALALGACNHRDTNARTEPAARKAGREAYHVTQEIKRGAKNAAHELRQAGKQAQQGWNQAKREDTSKPRK